jgi:protein TonB
MAVATAAGGWERAAVGRTTGALPGLLPSIALHVAAIALVILWVRSGPNGTPDQTAPQASFVLLVPAAEPQPEALPRWGLRNAAPEPPPEIPAPDPLLEQAQLPEIASEMASLPLAVFATAKPVAEPTPVPEKDAVAIEPAKPVPAPASVKLRKAQPTPPAAPKLAAKSKPKPVAKPAAAQPAAKPPAKPVSTAGDPNAKAQAASAATTTPSATQGSATAARASTASPVSDGPVLVTKPDYAGACPIQYPERARRRNQEGTVVIHALVGTDGKPIEVTVAASSGYSLLDDAARDAIAACAFEPQRVGGRPIKAIVEIPIPFKLI